MDELLSLLTAALARAEEERVVQRTHLAALHEQATALAQQIEALGHFLETGSVLMQQIWAAGPCLSLGSETLPVSGDPSGSPLPSQENMEAPVSSLPRYVSAVQCAKDVLALAGTPLSPKEIAAYLRTHPAMHGRPTWNAKRLSEAMRTHPAIFRLVTRGHYALVGAECDTQGAEGQACKEAR